jgi:hypothetical protein
MNGLKYNMDIILTDRIGRLSVLSKEKHQYNRGRLSLPYCIIALAIVLFGLSEFYLARLLVFQRLRILQKVVFVTTGMCDGTKEIK